MVRLSDLPGLHAAKRLATRLFLDESVHAVLLYGSPGAGQDKVAEALAAASLCLEPTLDGACGTCRSCGSFDRGTNPDVQFIGTHGAGNQIKIQVITKRPPKPDEPPLAVVPLRDYARTGPLLSRRKVAVLNPADRMNDPAFNAFLKLLEEPQPYMRFILVTGAIGRIPATIRSRCVAVACELPRATEVAERMGDLIDIYKVAPHLVERFADKRVGFDSMGALVSELGQAPPGAALKLAEEFLGICDVVGEGERAGRVGVGESLELLAVLISKSHPERPEWVRCVLEAHRRILGNVSSRAALDALFTEMVA